MSIRNISVLCACVATLAVSSSAMSQDTMRTRDSMARLQMQPPAGTMTVQGRDSLVAQLLDSANRVTDATVAQQLRDSVVTLRSLTVGPDMLIIMIPADSMMSRQNMQMTPQQRAQQQNMQQNAQQTYQQPQATSDQRLRVQKDWQNSNDPSGTYTPPAGRP